MCDSPSRKLWSITHLNGIEIMRPPRVGRSSLLVVALGGEMSNGGICPQPSYNIISFGRYWMASRDGQVQGLSGLQSASPLLFWMLVYMIKFTAIIDVLPNRQELSE